MALGIDDALMTAASSISLADTLMDVIKKYRREKKDLDIEMLIEEVRITALKRIDDADLALVRFQRTIIDRGINIDKTISDVVKDTTFWRPFEQYRLTQLQKNFNSLSDSIYSAADDIAALVRCRDYTGPMSEAVVESISRKGEFVRAVINAPSLKEAIELLRAQLESYKKSLTA